jgi:hypothetical protein
VATSGYLCCPASLHEAIACRPYDTDTTDQYSIDATDTDPTDPVQ